MSHTIPVTLSLPEDIVREIDKLAKLEKKSRSRFVTEALRRRAWLSRLEDLQDRAKIYATRKKIKSDKDVVALLDD